MLTAPIDGMVLSSDQKQMCNISCYRKYHVNKSCKDTGQCQHKGKERKLNFRMCKGIFFPSVIFVLKITYLMFESRALSL